MDHAGLASPHATSRPVWEAPPVTIATARREWVEGTITCPTVGAHRPAAHGRPTRWRTRGDPCQHAGQGTRGSPGPGRTLYQHAAGPRVSAPVHPPPGCSAYPPAFRRGPRGRNVTALGATLAASTRS